MASLPPHDVWRFRHFGPPGLTLMVPITGRSISTWWVGGTLRLKPGTDKGLAMANASLDGCGASAAFEPLDRTWEGPIQAPDRDGACPAGLLDMHRRPSSMTWLSATQRLTVIDRLRSARSSLGAAGLTCFPGRADHRNIAGIGAARGRPTFAASKGSAARCSTSGSQLPRAQGI
jgi:hypothetical protein